MVFPSPAGVGTESNPAVPGTVGAWIQARRRNAVQHLDIINPDCYYRAIKGDTSVMHGPILEINAQWIQIRLRNIRIVGHHSDRVSTHVTLLVIGTSRPIQKRVKENTRKVCPPAH